MNLTEAPSQENRSRLETLKAACNGINVHDVQSHELAADFVKQVRTLKQKLDAERKELVRPFNEGVKHINARFAAYTDPLEQMESAVRARIADYVRAEDKRRRDEIAAQALKAAEVAEVAGDSAEVNAILDTAADHTSTVKTIARSDLGTLSTTRKTWTYEVVDALELMAAAAKEPGTWARYVTVNEAAIKNAIREGVRSIPGVRIFERSDVVIR